MELTVHTHLSPRIIEVSDDTTSVTVQEVVDAVRDWEDDNLSYDKLISAAGKEALGGGVSVGITATLQNARLMFAARTTALETGTCTSDDSKGTTLTASEGKFVTNGIYKGCTVYNETSNSMAVVTAVVSETELQSFQITGGTRTTWLSGDSYRIYPNVQCSITGGNLVAVDENGDELSPVMQSPNVQVVRSSSSSATLQELSAIQFSSFQGGVWIDVSNGTAGTYFPTGTPQEPVSNLSDAKSIAEERGFDTFYILGNITITTGDNIDGYTIVGQNPVKTTIDIEAGASTVGCEYNSATISGVLDGNSIIEHCRIIALTYVEGEIRRCVLTGTIMLSGSSPTNILDCWSGVAGTDTPIIDMGGSGRDLNLRAYTGGIKIKNKNGSDFVSIDMLSGHVIIDSTVTSGSVLIRGVTKVTDNSDGATVDATHAIRPDMVADSVWDALASGHVSANSFGDVLRRVIGLGQENFRIKDQSYDGSGNLTSATVKLYGSATDCNNDQNEIAEYTITATYSGQNCTSYKVVKV